MDQNEGETGGNAEPFPSAQVFNEGLISDNVPETFSRMSVYHLYINYINHTY